MTFAPDRFFVVETLVPGDGWQEANTVFVREADGRYRAASGHDLTALNLEHPNFVSQTLDRGSCEECGARMISRLR